MKQKQTIAHTVLMIEPVNFGFNPQTAVNNYFQQADNVHSDSIQQQALFEFNQMVTKLRSKGIQVITVTDTPEPHTPDSIFPNNWITFHEDGQVITYPMFAKNRRLERRMDILSIVEKFRPKLTNTIDFSFWEEENKFLEGTGSMIFDRAHKIAYAAISERTDCSLFNQFCSTFDFKAVSFNAHQWVDGVRLPIYHTNVMLCVADKYAIICTDSIDNLNERTMVKKMLIESDKVLVEITEKQMHHFAGNMLQLANADNETFLVLSQTAFEALTNEQIRTLSSHNELIVCAVPTIERMGGGSVRCMMAEVY